MPHRSQLVEGCRKRKGDEVGCRWLVGLAPRIKKKAEQLAMTVASDPTLLHKLARSRYAGLASRRGEEI